MAEKHNDKNKEENLGESFVVGLDIGTTKICAVVAKENEYKKLEIHGHGMVESKGVKSGEIINIIWAEQAIKEAIEKASSKASIEINEVVVGIAGRGIKTVRQPDSIVCNNPNKIILQEDVKRLYDQVKRMTTIPEYEILHIFPQEYKVDSITKAIDPCGMQGSRLECDYNIVLGQSNMANNIRRCVENTGLAVEDLILEPVASAAAVLSEEEIEAGVVLVDIGGGTTDIAIFKDGLLRHTAVIPLGGESITKDIKVGCSVLAKQAESMKIKYGEALPTLEQKNCVLTIPGINGKESKDISVFNLSSIIFARLEDIFEFVMNEINLSGFSKSLSSGIVLTGGGSQLKNIKQMVEYKTGIDTSIGSPEKYVSVFSSEELKNPKYSTAIGLVCKTFSNYREQAENEEKSKKTYDSSAKKDSVKDDSNTKRWLNNILNRKLSLKDDITDFNN